MSLTSYRAAPPRVTVVGFVPSPVGLAWRSGPSALSLGGPPASRAWRRTPPRRTVGLLRIGTAGVFAWAPFGRPGGDLLSRALRRSTIGAEGFHGRVRNGIGCLAPRHDHQVIEAEHTRRSDADRRFHGLRTSAFGCRASSLPRGVPRERIGLGSSQTSD
jgi:hypothetical protein